MQILSLSSPHLRGPLGETVREGRVLDGFSTVSKRDQIAERTMAPKVYLRFCLFKVFYLLPHISKTELLLDTQALLSKTAVSELIDRVSSAGYDNMLLLNQ